MNEKALHILEYDKITARLAELASSLPGKEKCRNLQPLSDPNRIDRLQEETEAAFSRLLKKGTISFGSTYDVRASLKRLEIGSALGIHELLQITKLCENAALVKSYGEADRSETNQDILTSYFVSLDPLRRQTEEVRRCILSEDEIADDASPALHAIRRQIRQTEDRIHTELTRIISSSANRDILQDTLVTTRDGRYCIPVKNEFRSQVSGIIHDQSSSGSTVFIEPAAVVRLNNDIRELEGREQQEIAKILAELSEGFAPCSTVILHNYQGMVELDFIFARARLAMEQNATRPIIETEGVIDIRKARHPLIDSQKVVPIDIRLGETFDLLVITGPNTGGKTVSLKTTGLLELMGMAGLHIPAAARSRIAVFKKVYADIGDEQSIEQSLSTFSSHMTNVVKFLKFADRDSLVLFDELGAGTDPEEGAALAMAILDSLHQKGIRTMATTHYSEIKIYALRTPGVENASCEFDVATLSPTYRLLIGVPGKSNAFAISRKLGLPARIIDDARERISEEDESFEDVISNLDKQRSKLEKERTEAETVRRELKQLRKELEEQKAQLQDKKKNMISDSSAEAKRILLEAKEYADKTISYFQKHGGNVREMEQERQALRRKMTGLDKQIVNLSPTERARGQLTDKDLTVGDRVRILSLNLKGTVSTLPDKKGDLFVTCGIMRMKASLKDLEKLPDEDKVDLKQTGRKGGAGTGSFGKSMSISPEINLLGKTVDEATSELGKYLDDAFLAHLEQVRVVHGKGTGALRTGIHKYLKKNRHAASFRLGEFGEGDSGVTIVKIRY